jgi:hypothetical protein
MNAISPVEQATRLAEHSECAITRQLLTELLAVIEQQDKAIADMKRINADLRQCNECLNSVAAEAFPL